MHLIWGAPHPLHTEALTLTEAQTLLNRYILKDSLNCICLVGMKWAPTRQRPFVATKEYVWRQNEDYVGGATTCNSVNVLGKLLV